MLFLALSLDLPLLSSSMSAVDPSSSGSVVITYGSDRYEDRYPRWFISQPTQGGLWAVGYSRAYASRQTARDSAKMDAYARLRNQVSFTIQSERIFAASPGQPLSFAGAEAVLAPIADTLENVVYLDSAVTNGMALVLAHLPHDTQKSPCDEESCISSTRAVFAEHAPKWTQQDLPASKTGHLYGVGIARRYYHLENSWKLAEKRAWWELASRNATQVDGLERTKGRTREKIMSLEVAAVVRNAQVIARWTDGDAVYVLVKGQVI